MKYAINQKVTHKAHGAAKILQGPSKRQNDPNNMLWYVVEIEKTKAVYQVCESQINA